MNNTLLAVADRPVHRRNNNQGEGSEGRRRGLEVESLDCSSRLVVAGPPGSLAMCKGRRRSVLVAGRREDRLVWRA